MSLPLIYRIEDWVLRIKPRRFSLYRLKDLCEFYFRSLGIAGRNFVWDDCITVAGSISFVFLLGIIPFSALFLFLLSLFKDLFLPGLFPDDMIETLVKDISGFVPFVSVNWIRTHLIDSLGMGSFTTINLLMLPVISGMLFKSLEESFRRIFHLQRRQLLKGHIAYALMSIFVILLFFMANLIWTVVADAVKPLQAYLEQSPYIHDFYAIAIEYFTFSQINLVSGLILILFFLTTARVFLATPIRWQHRISAGILFSVLWMMAREIFGAYIQHVSRINVLFGSLSSVCILLLWIFYSSIALLYSVEFMYVLHRGPFRRWTRDSHREFVK